MSSQQAALSRRQASWLWWAAVVGLCLVLLAPLLIVDVPPMGDYPNHLARAFVLSALPDDAVLAKFYAPNWSIIPNLAIDLLAPSMMHVLPVHVVGRLIIAVSLLLPVLGTIAYNTAFGGRWWPLCVGLIAYNSCLLYGFLNFTLGLGLALLLASTWVRWREPYPARTIIVALAGTPIIFACHLMGLVFYATLITGVELARMRSLSPVAIVRRMAVVALVFALPTGLYAISALQNLGGDAAFLPPGQKLLQLVTTFANYNWSLDLITATVSIGLPILCLLTKRGLVPTGPALTIGILGVTFLAAPFAWKGTYLLDTRLAIMLGFMLFAGFIPCRWNGRFRIGAIAMLLGLFASRMILISVAWSAQSVNLLELRRAMEPIQPGSAVYVAEAGLEEVPAYWAADPHWLRMSNGVRLDEHLGALSLIERRAYWPFEFDIPSQQPLKTLPPYSALAARVGSLPNRHEALAAKLCGFDDLLMIDADAGPRLPPDRFHLLVDAGFAALYAISRCDPHAD